MPFFIWSEGFNVGVRELDSQHKQLIAMINAIQENLDVNAADKTITDMLHYANVHFRREEDLLRSIHYRGLDEQIREHKIFEDKTLEFATKRSDGLQMCEQLALFLRNWLSHHILEIDMKFKKEFIKQTP